MFRYFLMIVGYLFLFVGILGVLTPIPFGLIFMVISFIFLIPTAPWTLDAIKYFRRRFNSFDRGMDVISRKLPMPYRRIIRQSELNEYQD